jgi:hypothetical protein
MAKTGYITVKNTGNTAKVFYIALSYGEGVSGTQGQCEGMGFTTVVWDQPVADWVATPSIPAGQSVSLEITGLPDSTEDGVYCIVKLRPKRADPATDPTNICLSARYDLVEFTTNVSAEITNFTVT